MKKYRTRRVGARGMISTFSILLILVGLGLVGYSLLNEDSSLLQTMSKDDDPPPATDRDTALKLTIPKMERVEDLNVYDAPASDESALESGVMHVQGTGFPWEQGSNVYVAGHRLGYIGTDSYLVFFDLDKLQSGDEVFLTDSLGTRYVYTVFRSFVTDPYDSQVMEPIPGKSILSLQSCTLPDYSDRIIVQAELTRVE